MMKGKDRGKRNKKKEAAMASSSVTSLLAMSAMSRGLATLGVILHAQYGGGGPHHHFANESGQQKHMGASFLVA